MEATTLRKRQAGDLKFSGLIREGIIQGVYFLLGLLISSGASIGGISPFPASLTAAVPLRYSGMTVAGASLGYIITNPREAFRYIGVLVTIAGLKWLLNDVKKISRSPFFAPVIAFVPLVATGVALLYVSTSRMTDLSMCLIEASLSSAAAYFLWRTWELSESLRTLVGFNQQEIACLCVSGCILIFSLGSLEIFSVSVGRVLAIVLILMFAYLGGVGTGTIGGISSGLLFSLPSTSLSFLSGGFAFGGLVAGLFSNLGRLPAGVGFTLVNTLMSFAAEDKKLVLILFIEGLLATGIFMLIPTKFTNTVKAYCFPEKNEGDSKELREGVIARLDCAAEAIDSVKTCVKEVSQRLISQDMGSKVKVFETAAHRTCKTCGMRAYCFKRERESTREDFSKLWEPLTNEGFITQRDIDENFSKKCCKGQELAENINQSFRAYLSEVDTKQRIVEIQSLVGGQFSALSLMLSDLSENFSQAQYADASAKEKLLRGLKDLNIVAKSCVALVNTRGKMTIELCLVRRGRKEIDTEEIRLLAEEVTGRPFEKPVESFERDTLRLLLSQKSVYEVEVGSSQHIARGQNLCGDCCDYYKNGEGSLVAVLSDGMGTGGAAAVDSNMAVTILTRLLKAGLSYDSALSVVNSSLMAKSEEESTATLDVLEVNLFSGKISMMKAGAPTTFVRRAGRVYEREFSSLPVGILNGVTFKKEELTLHEGDVMLMVSDGALVGDDNWIQKMLLNWDDTPSADFASEVVNEAMKRRRGGHDDDITAIAIKLCA